jgi:hypothetical protein
MQPNMANKKSPPKFAIANGFVIGSFSQEVKWITSNGDTKKRIIKNHEVTDILKAMHIQEELKIYKGELPTF